MTDIVVIGAGIAGASIAAHLAETHEVILIEREDRPGYHSTGRSAALFTEIYGNSVIRALTRASRTFLFAPPPGFTETALIHPRGCLYIATAAQLGSLREFAAQPDIAPATRAIDRARGARPLSRAARGIPGRRLVGTGLHRHRRSRAPPRLPAAVPQTRRTALQQRSGRGARARRAGLDRARRRADRDRAHRRQRRRRLGGRDRRARGHLPPRLGAVPPHCRAGRAAARDEHQRVALRERYRRAVLFQAGGGLAVPLARRRNAHPSRRRAAGGMGCRRRGRSRAGCDHITDRPPQGSLGGPSHLRARSVAGGGLFRRSPGFFWLAGQGGYGIQTAPALSRTAAALVRGLPMPEDLLTAGVQLAHLSPSRFAS